MPLGETDDTPLRVLFRVTAGRCGSGLWLWAWERVASDVAVPPPRSRHSRMGAGGTAAGCRLGGARVPGCCLLSRGRGLPAPVSPSAPPRGARLQGDPAGRAARGRARDPLGSCAAPAAAPRAAVACRCCSGHLARWQWGSDDFRGPSSTVGATSSSSVAGDREGSLQGRRGPCSRSAQPGVLPCAEDLPLAPRWPWSQASSSVVQGAPSIAAQQRGGPAWVSSDWLWSGVVACGRPAPRRGHAEGVAGRGPR